MGGGIFFSFGGDSDSDFDDRDYERERFDQKAKNMWRKREEYSEQVEREREERRAARDARRAEVEAAKRVRKQRKETARSRFAQRLGCSPDGKLRYLDWSFSALKGEADKRKLKRPKLVDGATLAHLLRDDDERQAKRKKKPAVVVEEATPVEPSPPSSDAESEDDDFGQAAFFSRVAQKKPSPRPAKKAPRADDVSARARQLSARCIKCGQSGESQRELYFCEVAGCYGAWHGDCFEYQPEQSHALIKCPECRDQVPLSPAPSDFWRVQYPEDMDLAERGRLHQILLDQAQSLPRGLQDDFRDVQVVKTYLRSEISSSKTSKSIVSNHRGKNGVESDSDASVRFRASAKNDIPDTIPTRRPKSRFRTKNRNVRISSRKLLFGTKFRSNSSQKSFLAVKFLFFYPCAATYVFCIFLGPSR